MAKKKANDESMQSMIIGSILYDLEYEAHLPAEFVQALREELTAHPEKLGLDKESEEEQWTVFHALMTEVGQRLYGDEWANIVAPLMGMDEETIQKSQYLPSDNIQKCIIRISLKNVKPIVWRKLEVPSNITLSYLAEVLIYVMGWEGYHLHQFRKNGVYYKEITEDDEYWFEDDELKDEAECTLGQVLTQKGDKMVLEYDFGDGWEHQVSLTKIESYADEEPPFPHLLSGKNACPPEDCGGPWGYAALCQYYYTRKKDPNFPKEHYTLVDKHFNPEFFPLAEYKADIEDMNKA